MLEVNKNEEVPVIKSKTCTVGELLDALSGEDRDLPVFNCEDSAYTLGDTKWELPSVSIYCDMVVLGLGEEV